MVVYNQRDTIWAPPGKAVDDNGATHATVQDAVDAAGSMVLVGPGTFEENVTIPSGMGGGALIGVGAATLIDGGTGGHAIDLQADDFRISSLAVQTTAGQGGTGDGINTGAVDSPSIDFVTVNDSDRDGISTDASAGGWIALCHVKKTDRHGINNNGTRTAVGLCYVGDAADDISNVGIRLMAAGSRAQNCYIYEPGTDGIFSDTTVTDLHILGNTIEGAGDDGIETQGDRDTVKGNTIIGAGDDGISANGDDQSITMNTIHNPTNAGIKLNATDQYVDGNVFTSIGGVDINVSAATTPRIGGTEEIQYEPGMVNWADALSNEEIYRLNLAAGERFHLRRVGLELKGGGTQASLDIDVYDETNTTELGSTTAGSVSTAHAVSGAGAAILVRLSNSVGSAQDAAPVVHGVIE